ncbi:MAG: PBP1A family penicillin-binding protein [Acinetobacter sp.]|nr:PBP1A family penicillin-binding protein [Acinetobacter sp.]
MKKKSIRSRLTHPVIIASLMGIFSIPMGFYGMHLYIAPSLPDISTLKKAPVLKPLQIYTADEQLIAEFGTKLSLPVEYKQIPQHFIHAFLAAEDSTFFEHGGISFKSLGRALSESVTGSDVQTGGSTITMQVAKNYYLTPDRTLKRKLTEIFLARHIEENLTKEEILTLYVNKIFLGKNAYGIAAAAQIYYNKKLDELTIAEMAMLAGLPKAPSKFNPVNNPERALERRNWILGRMLQLGYINKAQYDEAIAAPINLNMVTRDVPNRFPYVAELVRNELVMNFGEHAIDSGYKVYTTIDSIRQTYAEQAVQKGLEDYDRRHGWHGVEAHDKPLEQFMPYGNSYPAKVLSVSGGSFTAEMQDGKKVTVHRGPTLVHRSANAVYGVRSVAQLVKPKDIVYLRANNEAKTSWYLVHIPKVQGQLISIHPNDGAVVAVVGGYNYFHSKFNRATQGWRQPGSIIKPFVYALALERGMTPDSVVSDSRITISGWSPKNADGRYVGPMSLRRALYLSRNTVSVRLLRTVGLERARQLFIDFGLQEDQIPRNYTIALGTPQVLPIQMATGYATFANGGYRVQPYFIKRITDINDKEIYKATPAYACIPCIAKNEEINAKYLKQHSSLNSKADEKAEDAKATAKDVKAKNAAETANDNNEPTLDKVEIKGEYMQAQRILKSSSAYEMASILRDVIRVGTGRAAQKVGRGDLGGKTGTTNDAKDAWFAGFNGQLVTVVWVGFDKPSTLGRKEYGGIAALPIWANYMAKALKGTPSSWVTLDKNAKDPISRESKVDESKAEEVVASSSIPPMARSLYGKTPSNNTSTRNTSNTTRTTRTEAPKTSRPVAPAPVNRDRDFEDLPDQMITDTPAPKPRPTPAPAPQAPKEQPKKQTPAAPAPQRDTETREPAAGSLENLLDGNM